MTTAVITTTSKVEITESITHLDQAMESVIAEFNATKAAIKSLETKKQELEASLRDSLKGNDVGHINGVERVRVSHRSMSKVDRDILKTAFPEAYEASLTETPYTVLQAK